MFWNAYAPGYYMSRSRTASNATALCQGNRQKTWQASHQHHPNSSHGIGGGTFSPTCPLRTKRVAYTRGASRASTGTIVDISKPYNKPTNQKFVQSLNSRGFSDFLTTPPKLSIQPPVKSQDHSSHQHYNRNDNEACSPTELQHDSATYEMAIKNCYYYSIQNNGQKFENNRNKIKHQ